MKTLVVLSFLVSFALAAPTSQEKTLEVAAKEVASKTPDLIKREKKSPQLHDEDAPSLPEGGSGFQLPSDFNADVDSPTASARSFGFKKHKGPIIVKKHSGYHLYRDSEEERAAADPSETCGKHLRVKVCNAKASGKSADLTGKNAELSNNDIESSIQVAKEAIESLEKDMLKLEQTGHWKHGKSEEDTSMHHNIETVREALHQVQGRIGKLEVMNLQAKTMKSPLALDDMIKGKSEEERIAQWKEAMENIEKNVEVARNIEDSFKSADELPEEISHSHKFMMNADEEHKNHEMSGKSTTDLFDQHTLEDHKDKHIGGDLHKPIEKSTDEILDDHEMTIAASEPIESKIKHDLQPMTLGKSTEMFVDDLSNTQNSKHNTKFDDKKDRDADKDLSLNNINDDKNQELHKEETAFKVAENKKYGLKPLVTGEHTHDIENAARGDIKKTSDHIVKPAHLSKGKNAWEEIESEDNSMKTVDQTDMVKEATNEMKSELERSSLKDDKMTNKIHNEALKQDKHEFQMKHSDSDLMSTHNPGMHMSGHEMKMPGHGMHMQGHDMGFVGHDMKMHGHGMHMGDSQHDMYKPKYGKHMPGYDMHMQGHDMHMQGHGMHMQGHGMQMPGQGMHMSNPGHMRKQGKYGKSADLDNAMQPSMQMNMREASGKSAMDKMFQWKHHDLARTAYGGSYGAGGYGSDALGVFPNAKVGGCGIPLLLSCSPSVVQGSLAKSHSSYGSPAYRTEDDFGLKKKRDILKTKETKKDDIDEKVNPTATKKNIEILDTLN